MGGQIVFRSRRCRKIFHPYFWRKLSLFFSLLFLPGWIQIETKHYRIYSQISEEKTYLIGGWAENMFRQYQQYFPFPPPKGKFTLKVFESQQELAKYLRKLGLPTHWQGAYLRTRKQLLLSHKTSPREFQSLLFHEGFHQFFEYYYPAPPVWLNEGLAEYFGHALFWKGNLLFGLPHLAHLRKLKKEFEKLPLSELLSANHRQFHKSSNPRYYAKSWLFIHYLVHRRRGTLQKMLEYLRARESIPYSSLLGSLSSLEASLARYLEKLWHTSGEVNYRKAFFWIQKKQYPRAVNLLSDALAQNPYHEEARHYRGVLLYLLKDYSFAVKDLTMVIRMGYHWPTTFYYRGLCYLALWDLDSSLEDLRYAAQLAPHDPKIQRAKEQVEKILKKSKN